METRYTVNAWGSEPGTEDDCWYGEDFTTLEAARDFYDNPPEDFLADQSTAWIELAKETRAAPSECWAAESIAERKIRDPKPVDDSDWRREIAMQAGMMAGCDAYNDAMGW